MTIRQAPHPRARELAGEAWNHDRRQPALREILGRLDRWRGSAQPNRVRSGSGCYLRVRRYRGPRRIRAMGTQAKEQRRHIMRAPKSRDRASAMIVRRFLPYWRQTGQIRRRIVELLSIGHSNPRICVIGQQDLATRRPLAPRWSALESLGETAS